MTAHISRPVRAALPQPADEVDAALGELEENRSTERALRMLVAESRAGASALSTAQWRVQLALERLDSLGWKPPTPESPDPDRADWDGSA